MKLISLYIENFGGLQQYQLDFEAGVTTIFAPNGFGKTTLAEFIRAMFYGFPRKAKALDKSRRQKYTPWQGGKFGGNLVFEFEGRRYRMERSFGATPKGDSFNLIDLSTNKKSTRFSENIGMELFRLDADSFERSTYMPQLHDLTSLTTDGIQAKLADLVEDAGDMGNFEKAMTALKSARSGFIPYRGNGGSVADARNQISHLQTELDRCAGLEDTRLGAKAQIGQAQTRLTWQKQQREELRSRILQASEAAAVTAVHREYSQISGQEAQLKAELDALQTRYPKGLPAEDQITLARDTAGKARLLAAHEITTPEDTEAGEFLNINRSRFDGRIPSAEALEACRSRISRRNSVLAEAEATGLSRQEQQQYETLLPIAEAGKLSQARIDTLDDASRALTKVLHKLDALQIPEEDQRRLDELKAYFSVGTPEEEAILSHREHLREIHVLRKEKADTLEELARLQPQKMPPLLLMGILFSLAAIAAGTVLLVNHPVTIGCLALIPGILALIGSIVGLIRLGKQNREISNARYALEMQAENLRCRITEMDQAVADFTGRYTVLRPLTDALNEIRHNLEELKKLATEIAAVTARQKQLTAEVQALRAQLTEQLGDVDFDRAILDLRLARSQFHDLQAEKAAAEEKIAALRAEGNALTQAITGFLGAYYDAPLPEQFHSLLSDLQRSSERYTAAQERVRLWKQRQKQHAEETAACAEILHRFFVSAGLAEEADLRGQLLRIRDDRRTWAELTARHRQVSEEKEAYEAANRDRLEKEIPETPEDLTELRLQEHRLNEAIEADTSLLLRQQQLLGQTEEELKRLPELRDDLAHWQAEYAAGREQASLLDDTMDFLEKAREQLQNSYLGPVRSSFEGYMNRLLQEDGRQILLTPDLEVQLERKGQARELGYFSAGQTDTVMLCMRLALVDALFGAAKPFVILDDPFVNLDDDRTAQALALLAELARDRQILYLTCNSSRTL